MEAFHTATHFSVREPDTPEEIPNVSEFWLGVLETTEPDGHAKLVVYVPEDMEYTKDPVEVAIFLHTFSRYMVADGEELPV